MQNIINLLTGAGAVSLIGVLAAWIESQLGRNQHQKDVTVAEIRRLRSKLKDYDKKIDTTMSLKKSFELRTKLLLCLSIWSVNFKFSRVSKSMIKYDLYIAFKKQYKELNDDLPVFLLDPSGRYIAWHVIKLFCECDIISVWKAMILWIKMKRNELRK